jgi:hypothetical protein
MAKLGNNGFRTYIKYALIFLGIVLVILMFFLVREIVYIKRSEDINIRKIQFSSFLKSHGPMTVNDAGIIAPWMTFDYINRLFKLPPEFLKTSLVVTDSRYPQISISGYARSEGMNATVFIGEVQSDLRDYLINKK